MFLFDLDGLLVNTEEIHYHAYREMLKGQGFALPWDFKTYCMNAHYGTEKLKGAIYREFPDLSPDWDPLYKEKQGLIVRFLNEGEAHLMPGVEKLLKALNSANIPSCVVTNSPDNFVSIIRQRNPILDHIPYWITRHDYTHPKPDPECYLLAIKRYGTGRVIGFEDTPRGVNALIKTPAKPVMISSIPYPDIPALLNEGVTLFPSLDAIPDSLL